MSEELLFEAALKAPAAERGALLDRACAGQPELRERLERLLAAHAQSGCVVDQPLDQTAAYAGPAEGVGAVVAGRYKLLEQIGEGGMGAVYVAEQTQPVRRKVALKLIKPGMDSKAVLARFEAERQALAMMDHPSIAKVLDGGLTAAGRPFFVMEYVKGVSITDYCDSVRLGIRERLELFAQVCQAVQHAHQKGVIHRDLKPSNILVAPYDGKPVPKVIDFGLAKAIHQSLTERTLHTAHDTVLGTPLYMSPEQAQLNNLDVDTRSDIYSLGVLLYELLTGTTPLEKQRFKQAAWDEVRRVIREEEPPRPSARLSSTQTLPALAANRGSEPAKLTNLMRGELDWIVMKALEKDRTRRYETANGFARDVQRYLADELVEARPPSAGYRLKKFVRRNRGQVIAVGIILGLLLAGIAGTSFGLYRATQSAEAERLAKVDAEAQKEKAIQSAVREAEERKKADAAKAEAQAREADAFAVVTFFEQKVFAAARPKGQEGGLGGGVTLRDAVVASMPALEKAFAEQPEVEAYLRQSLGVTFSYLAEHDQARSHFERARALFTQQRGPESPDTLRSMSNLAVCFDALNRPIEAHKLREEVLAIQKRVLPPEHPNTLASMNNLAASYEALNRQSEALDLRKEVLSIRKRLLPPEHPDILSAMHNLANSYSALNRPTEALKLSEEVLAIRKRVLSPDHPLTLVSMYNVAVTYETLNRKAEALKLLEEVLPIQKRVLPPDHRDTLNSLNNLAASYAELNRMAEAFKLFEEVVAIRKRVLPLNHPATLLSMYNLANCCWYLNRRNEAIKLFEEVLEIQRRVLRKDHPNTLMSMNNLAASYADLNRPAEAIKLFEEVLEIQKRTQTPNHPDTLMSTCNLAVSYAAMNRHADALPVVNEVLAAANRPGGDPRLVPLAIDLRLRCCQKANDPAGCRASAEMWEKLNRSDAKSLYDAARYHAVTAGVQAKAPGADGARLAQEDADTAIVWLTKALAAGYKDATHMKTDTDLDPLREREDFKKLLAELEAKAGKT